MRPELQRLVGELGLQHEVEMGGALPHADMPSIYAKADVLAAPSVVAPNGDRDGLPNVVTEAMATGLPVVGSRLSGIPEAIEPERTGLLVPPGNAGQLARALERMLTDAALRRRCIDNAREKVETRFDVRENSCKVYRALRRVAR
jgi:glycosyltransferase involved in cell wall biosynthesis